MDVAELRAVIKNGDLRRLESLIETGADIRFKDEDGYNAAIDAAYAGHVVRGPKLLELFRLLIAHGCDLDSVTTYGESALRVLSHVGRFDVIQLLLDSGADKTPLAWTPLIEAVSVGTRADVEATLKSEASLEDRDCWNRTAWHIALLIGDIEKAQLLLDHGADFAARGHCGFPPIHYAIQGRHLETVRWLLDQGADVNVTDEFGLTPLIDAIGRDDLDCVDVLLKAGAKPDAGEKGSVIHYAGSRKIIERLFAAGCDSVDLSVAGRRALLNYPVPTEWHDPSEMSAELEFVSTQRFGQKNPELLNLPFWDYMIRKHADAYAARKHFERRLGPIAEPVWSAQRFGQSFTILGDGRIVQIGGEHEDFYDPDFCIYNDVFVHNPDGSIEIYGYPVDVFPPTDFHTATLIGDSIIVIGSLGYAGARQYGETPVYRLDLRSFRMDRVETTGEAPGWIYDHRAAVQGHNSIRIFGGKIVCWGDSKETHESNNDAYVLDLKPLTWRRE